MKKIKNFFYSRFLRLDMATLVTDSKLKKLFIRKILRPIGFYFRKKYYNLNYK